MSTLKTLGQLKREAFSGELPKASLQRLEEYSAALCHSQAYTVFADREFPQVCETVRTHLLRSHIETLQDHVVELHGHITKLNASNAKIQWWVIALAVAALIAAVVQTTVAIRAELRAEPITQSSSPQQQRSAPPLETPAQAVPQSSGQSTKKAK